MNTDWQKEIEVLKERDQYRILRDLKRIGSTEVKWKDQTYVNLSSNDYLGLAQDTVLLKEFYQRVHPDLLITEFSPGAASSRLLTGNHSLYQRVESRLAALYQKPSALIFASGTHANQGILPALSDSSDAVFADKLIHASLVDGIRLSGAKLFRYPHNDLEALEKLLNRHAKSFRRKWVVTESVFSMDGDRAPLKDLCDLKDRFEALLYLDEAHSCGVMGDSGLGLAEEDGVLSRVDFLVGTFGKAFAGMGAYVLCEVSARELLINKARTLIFSTALPPVTLNWIDFVLTRLPELKFRRDRLKDLYTRLKQGLIQEGFEVRGDSQILPVILKENSLALKAAEKIQNRGFLLFAIRPPTVPPHTARLRISLSAALNQDDLKDFPTLLRECVS